MPKAVVYGYPNANLMTPMPEIPNTIFSVYPERNAVFIYYYSDPINTWIMNTARETTLT